VPDRRQRAIEAVVTYCGISPAAVEQCLSSDDMSDLLGKQQEHGHDLRLEMAGSRWALNRPPGRADEQGPQAKIGDRGEFVGSHDA
jgi:hypothetical protein